MANTTFSGPVISENGFQGAVTGAVTGTLTGNQIMPTATVAAAGANQAGAGAVTTGFTLVSAADGTKGVRLPLAAAGLICIIKNAVGNQDLKVYPGTSDKINGGAANAALTMAGGTSAILIAYDATDWYSIPLLPS